MPKFRIEPYRGVDKLDFGMGPEEVQLLFGEPSNAKKNFFKEDVLYYDGFYVCFTRSDCRVVEIGFTTKCDVTVKEIDIFSDPNSFEQLLRENGGALSGVGCIVLLTLGIAITGFIDDEPYKTVTAFAHGRWDSQLKHLKHL